MAARHHWAVVFLQPVPFAAAIHEKIILEVAVQFASGFDNGICEAVGCPDLKEDCS